MESEDTVVLAQAKLNSFMEGKRTLDPSSNAHAYNWHIKRRKEEIERFGDGAAAHLIPLLVRFHSRAVHAFLDHNIHTKQDLAQLSDEQLREIAKPRGATRDTETLTLLEILRDLATVELNQWGVSEINPV